MRLRGKRKIDYMVDITPLVDVVFLMLIFFMVSTSFSVATSLKLELPASKSHEQVTETEEVVVSISADGQFYVGEEKVADEDLRKRVLNASKGNPNIRVVLRADGDAAHKRVVFVLDTLRQLGIGKVAIATIQDLESGQ